jgi:glycosyltransferase involved in cell wall biosynthesis
MFVADLARALDPMGVDQMVTILHGDRGGDVDFGVDTIRLAPGGRTIPGLRIDGGLVRGIRDAVRRWRPSLLQAHGGEALKHSIVAAGGRIPVVYRRIGSTSGWGPFNPRRAAHSLLVRRAAHVICVSDSARREIVRSFRVPLSRASTIPNAVDLERIKPTRTTADVRAELGIATAAPGRRIPSLNSTSRPGSFGMMTTPCSSCAVMGLCELNSRRAGSPPVSTAG